MLVSALPNQASAQTNAQQSHAAIHDIAAAFIRAQTLTLQGQVSIKVDEIDPRIVRPTCPTLEAFLPSGSQLIGNTIIGVRCSAGNIWTLFIPVKITVIVNMLTANKPLKSGHIIQLDDLSHQKGELTQIGILLENKQAIGKMLRIDINAGQALKQDMLQSPYVVTQGQIVQLQVGGAGFSLRSEGSALKNAIDGETIQVKTSSGQVVSGTARQGGIVEMRP